MRVTVTVPQYLVPKFEQLSEELGLSRQDTFLHCLTNALSWKEALPVLTAPLASSPMVVLPQEEDEERDLYMMSAPEKIRVYTFSQESVCLRGAELGEYHEIDRGQRFGWVRFTRDSKKDAEGWEQGKNGKLCEPCHKAATLMWQNDEKYL